MKDIVGYLVAMVCWVLTAPTSMLVIFQIRNTLNTMWPLFGSSNEWRWMLRPVDRFLLLMMGIGWLAFVFLSLVLYAISVVQCKKQQIRELAQASPWKRTLCDYGLYVLLRRFLYVMGVLILLLVLSHIAQELARLALAARSTSW